VGGRKRVVVEKAAARAVQCVSVSTLAVGPRNATPICVCPGIGPGRGSPPRVGCRPSVNAGSGCLLPALMMQTADQRHFDHFPNPRGSHRTQDWTVVGERPVRSDLMVEVQSTIPHNTRCRKFAIRGTTSTVNKSSSEGVTIVWAGKSVSAILRAKGCRIVLKCRHGCWIERIVYDLGRKPNRRWIGKRWSGCSNF
jgi:hypothetical protein